MVERKLVLLMGKHGGGLFEEMGIFVFDFVLRASLFHLFAEQWCLSKVWIEFLEWKAGGLSLIETQRSLSSRLSMHTEPETYLSPIEEFYHSLSELTEK